MKESKDNILIIPLEKILPNRFQPRIKFSEESILNLADSIKEHGVLQPIIVRSLGDKYEIVAGERRYKATVLSGLKEIPALLFDMNDKDSAEIALIENVQRKDLSPIEEAISYKKILDMGYLTQSDLATKIGVSQSAVANKLRLLNLCDDVQEALLDEKISERHARSLLKLDSDDIQAKMLKRVLSKKLTVRALDDEIEFFKKNQKFKETEEKENISEVSREPRIEIKNTSEEIEISPKESIEKIRKEFEEEKEFEKNIDIKETKDESKEETKETKDDISSVFEDVSETDDNKEEEKDMNNNLQNLNEDINYNTLKTSNANPGKFFMSVEEEKETKEEPKEENKDTNSIFNFENSNNSGNIFSDLMAPQGSKNLFRPGTTQESVIPVSNVSQNLEEEKKDIANTSTQNVSSMFENLMGVSTSSNQEIDKDTFAQFMDPSFVDGQKQELNENNNVNSNIFSKFINETNEEKPAENDMVKVEEQKKDQEISSSIFGNLFSKDKKEENNTNATSIDTPKSGIAPSIFSGFGKIFDDSKKDISVEEPVKIESTIEEKEKNDTISEVKSNNEVSGDIFSTPSSNMPDLLAPMGDINNIEPLNFDNIPNDILSTENKENSELNTLVAEEKKEEVSSSDNLSNEETVEVSEIVEENDEIKSDEKSNEESNEESEKEISFNTEKPIFVTASSTEDISSMPTTPIIDVPEEPIEEEKEEITEVENKTVVEEEIPETVVNEEAVDEEAAEVDNEIDNMIGNQPIIVTDYNKQYDPIIPNEGKPVEKIEFKKILSLIRELSETIEKCGYEIDTDEIDLQDKYQVIFNINKQ